MVKNKLKLHRIFWRDAYDVSQGWFNPEDFDFGDFPHVEEIGFLFYQDDNKTILVNGYNHDTGEFSRFSVIPTKLIVENKGIVEAV